MGKVLGVTAIGPGKEYVGTFLEHTFARIDGVDSWRVLLDNVPCPVTAPPDNLVFQNAGEYTGPDNRFARIAWTRELLRQYFLTTDATHLLMLDSDVIPPADVVARLLAHETPISSAALLVRDCSLPQLTIEWIDLGVALRDSTEFHVSQSGMGCMLVDRATIARVSFREPSFYAADSIGEDFQWCLDAGAPTLLDASLCCWHVSANGAGNRITIGERTTTATYKGSPDYVTNGYGCWANNVPRADLTPDQMATLGPDFVVRAGRALGVEWRTALEILA